MKRPKGKKVVLALVFLLVPGVARALSVTFNEGSQVEFHLQTKLEGSTSILFLLSGHNAPLPESIFDTGGLAVFSPNATLNPFLSYEVLSAVGVVAGDEFGGRSASLGFSGFGADPWTIDWRVTPTALPGTYTILADALLAVPGGVLFFQQKVFLKVPEPTVSALMVLLLLCLCGRAVYLEARDG